MHEKKTKYYINLMRVNKVFKHLRKAKKITRTDMEVIMWAYHFGVFRLKDFAQEFETRYAKPKVDLLIARGVVRKKVINMRNGAGAFYLTTKSIQAAREVYRILKGLQ